MNRAFVLTFPHFVTSVAFAHGQILCFFHAGGIGTPTAVDRDGYGGVQVIILGPNPLIADADAPLDGWKVSGGYGLEALHGIPAAAPVADTGGCIGITIHLDTGNEASHDSELFPVAREFAVLKAAPVNSARQPMFDATIRAKAYGIFDRLGADGKKMGALVHDLDQRHGGPDDEGYRPNRLGLVTDRRHTGGAIGSTLDRASLTPIRNVRPRGVTIRELNTQQADAADMEVLR